MPLETGQIINNRYRIVKLLGQGGFGAVYRAWDVNLKGPCAIKENSDVSPGAQSQFAREASILYNLRHPNLPKVTDHFSIPGQGQYLVMEFIEGQDLQEKIDQAGGLLPEEQVLPWMSQICDALIYLHGRTPPIIHRDIKPANVRITPEGTVYLVDFGIAKLYDPERKTTLGARAVTPGYAPFEQYGQKPTDARTDIYALGATLYAALTGKVPVESIERIAGSTFPSLRSLNPAISPQTEAAVLRAMEPMPDQRYQSAMEFKAALTPQTATRVTPSFPQTVSVAPTQMAAPTPISSLPKPSHAPPAPSLVVRRRLSWLAPVVIAGMIVLAIGVILVAYSVFREYLTGYTPTEALAVVSPTNTPVEPVAPMPQPFVCTDPLGCVDVPPGEPVTLGYALVVSGPSESLGIDARNGIQIAIDDKGQLMGHQILLIGEDEGCSAEGGQAAGVTLAANPNIVAIIGTSCSSAARSALPILSEAGFVVVSPSNTATDLTDPNSPHHYPGYLRTSWNDIIQGEAAARFAWEHLKARRAATIHDNSMYANSLQEIFAQEFRRLGGEITAQEAVDPSQTDMNALLQRLASGNPDLVYLPIFLPAGGNFVRQAREIPGLTGAHLMGADGLFAPELIGAAGDAVEGFMVSSPYISGPAYDAFVARYKEKFNIDPLSIFHANAYDAAMMIFAAIEKVGVQSSDGSLHIPRKLLRQAMYATRNFQGITGSLTCNPNGDCANPVIAVYRFHAGQYPPERIWP